LFNKVVFPAPRNPVRIVIGIFVSFKIFFSSDFCYIIGENKTATIWYYRNFHIFLLLRNKKKVMLTQTIDGPGGVLNKYEN